MYHGTMRKIRFISAAAVAALAVTLLAGCSMVTNEDRDACAAKDGHLTSERYPYGQGPFGELRTGKLHYCASDNGTILAVYNKHIESVDEGLFGPSERNRMIFEECEERGGDTYRTRISKSTRYACVLDGAYVRILD